jgi:hypothetical protein
MGKLKLKLIPGKEYLFTHKRKRTFRAEFKRFVRAPATDTMDELYYECEVDAALSGNPWTTTHEGTKAVTLLRPSLITLVQDAPKNARPMHHMMPRAQDQTIRQPRENWVRERIQSIQSLFRHLRRI